MTNHSSDSSNAVAAITAHLKRAREASEYQTAQDELAVSLGMLQMLEASDRENVEMVIWMDYSMIAEHFGDLKTAIDYNEKVALRRPDDLPSHLALSKLYSELGEAERATESLRKCSELAERLNDTTALAMLATKGHLPAQAEARARRLEDAVSIYRDALERFTLEASPDRYAATQTTIGKLTRQQADLLTEAERTRKLEEAAEAYREALKVHTTEAFPDKNRALLENLAEIENLLLDLPSGNSSA